MSHYLIENKNIAWSVNFCFIAMFRQFYSQFDFGFGGSFFDYKAIWWHVFSPYFVLVLIILRHGLVGWC